jgi:hypothetical protein
VFERIESRGDPREVLCIHGAMQPDLCPGLQHTTDQHRSQIRRAVADRERPGTEQSKALYCCERVRYSTDRFPEQVGHAASELLEKHRLGSEASGRY